MNVFLYIIIFIMGTLFGSFYTLAVYRIPKKLDITHNHSFCPNCGHKLGFFELIPILSYIFLGGKCKNCKQKIRPRYIILEILSGFTFVLIAYSLKINVYNNLNLNVLIIFAFKILYITAIFLIAGIDKEYRKIEKSVLYYSLAVSSAYIIYLCIMDQTSIYRYVMYLATLIILLILDCEKQIKEAKVSYIYQILMLIIVMVINTGIFEVVSSIIIVFLSIGITRLICFLRNAVNKSRKEKIIMNQVYKFGYLFGLTNVIIYIGTLYFVNH